MCQPNQDCPVLRVCINLQQPNTFVGPSVEEDQPISYPINDLDDLFKWKANDCEDHGQCYSVARVSHNPKIINKDSTKTLVCHDMKGGYLKDRFVQGLEDKGSYHTSYWNMIDIFVYFSHHFVTIPPVCWVNSAHRNGVTTLGTFICEGDEGYERCKNMFSSKERWRPVADKLVEIARFYRFDGWFINIENNIDTDKVSEVIDFVTYLTTQMHAVDNNALVIWYDSVTCDGALQWQNELNQSNKCFYDACDGIFLNYGWKEANLKKSKSVARSSSSVFVGIDVFGRGCFGGGGFNSAMAMELIKQNDLSAGIFAPGWVYETFKRDRKFDEKDEQFWKALQPYCCSHPLDAHTGMASDFNPGYKYKKCFNNSQNTMPLLPSSYISMKVDQKNPDGKVVVSVPIDSQEIDKLIDVFKIQMKLQDTCATLISSVNCDLNFVLQIDGGIIEADTQGHTYILPSGEEVKLTTYAVKGAAMVQGIAIKINEHDLGCELPLKFLQLLPGLHGEGDFPVVSCPIKCADVFWKDVHEDISWHNWYDEYWDGKFFSFSATLIFEDLPDTVAFSDVDCKIHSSYKNNPIMNVFLGSSYCSQFRIHNMLVADPIFNGPDCYLLFTVSYRSNAGIKIGESQLKVIYAENI